jgi:hypothetical protein
VRGGLAERDENRFERYADARNLGRYVQRKDQLECPLALDALDRVVDLDAMPPGEVLDGECRFDFELRRAQNFAGPVLLRLGSNGRGRQDQHREHHSRNRPDPYRRPPAMDQHP